MDVLSTKKKRGRPSKGLSDYSKVTARLTDEQYNALIDYGRTHIIVDKKGAVNPSEVVRVAIDNLTASVYGEQSRESWIDPSALDAANTYDPEEITRMMKAIVHLCRFAMEQDDFDGIPDWTALPDGYENLNSLGYLVGEAVIAIGFLGLFKKPIE